MVEKICKWLRKGLHRIPRHGEQVGSMLQGTRKYEGVLPVRRSSELFDTHVTELVFTGKDKLSMGLPILRFDVRWCVIATMSHESQAARP